MTLLFSMNLGFAWGAVAVPSPAVSVIALAGSYVPNINLAGSVE